jgi:hypothetical protein
MPKPNDKALANVAYQSAVSAMATSKAYGILFSSILRALLNKGTLTLSDAETLFFGAAGIVDAGEPKDELQKAVRKHMRKMIEEAARGFAIQIPPQGQTGIQITQ